jgi:hypothetical protein
LRAAAAALVMALRLLSAAIVAFALLSGLAAPLIEPYEALEFQLS